MKGSRKQFAIKNITFNIVNKLLTLILSFVSRSVFIWEFGVNYLGINGLFTDVLALLSMADLGFGIAMVYSFYEQLKNNNYEKIAGLIGFYRKVYRIVALAVGVVGIAIIPILPYLINLNEYIPNLYVYYVLSLLNVVFSYLFVYKTSILSADQKNYVVVRISMFCNIFRTIIQILLILIFKNYVIYLSVAILFTLVNNIWASKIASREYPYIDGKVKISKSEQKVIYKNLFSVFLFKISSVLMNGTDNILISILVGTIAVGYYSNYLLIQNQIISFYAVLFASVTSSVGNLIVTEKAEKRYSVFQVEQGFGFIMSGILVPCYTVLINDFIKLWLGNEYLLDKLVVLAIGINMYLSCVLQPIWSFREATGLYRKTKWIMVICAVINILLSILLGKIWGITGIILASAISRLSTYVWYEPPILFKQYFEHDVLEFYKGLIKNTLLVCVNVVICYMVANFLPVMNLIQFVIEMIFILCISTTMAVATNRNSDVIKSGYAFIRKKIRGINRKIK